MPPLWSCPHVFPMKKWLGLMKLSLRCETKPRKRVLPVSRGESTWNVRTHICVRSGDPVVLVTASFAPPEVTDRARFSLNSTASMREDVTCSEFPDRDVDLAPHCHRGVSLSFLSAFVAFTLDDRAQPMMESPSYHWAGRVRSMTERI